MAIEAEVSEEINGSVLTQGSFTSNGVDDAPWIRVEDMPFQKVKGMIKTKRF